MTKLSEKLQKYYTRHNNRLVFINGLSLNQMAWAMWERLGFREIDPSALSRVLNGERLFTIRQIHVFCVILGIHKAEERKLKETLIYEVEDKFGIGEFFWEEKTATFIENIKENFEKIKKVKESDRPSIAYDWIKNTIEKIDEHLPNIRDTEQQQALLDLKGNLLNQYLDVLLCTDPPDSYGLTVIPACLSLSKVSSEIQDKILQGLSYSLLGNAYRAMGNYELAIQNLSHGIKTGLSSWGEVAALRAFCLAASHVNNKKLFEDIVIKILELIKRKPQHADYLYEGVARGYARFGDVGLAKEALQKAWTAHEVNEKSYPKYLTLKKFEIFRSELEVVKLTNFKYKTPFATGVYKQQINEAKKLGYNKVAGEIEDLLTTSQ